MSFSNVTILTACTIFKILLYREWMEGNGTGCWFKLVNEKQNETKLTKM